MPEDLPSWRPATGQDHPRDLVADRHVADYYRYYAGIADKIEGSYLPIDKPDMDVWLRREPIGVVAMVVPWNSQLFLSAVKIGPHWRPAAPWW